MKALLALVLLSGVAAATPCPILEYRPTVLTPAGTDVGAGGGVVIGWGSPWGQQPSRFDKTWTSWKFAGGIPVTRTELAPGLEVYAGPKATQLEDGKGKVIATVTRGTATTAMLAAPDIVSIGRLAPTTSRHPYVNTTATVKAVPAGAVALIAYDEAGKVADTWGGVAAKATEVSIYASGGCGQLPPNMVDVPVGAKLRLAWVDAAGRVGALSKPVAVRAKQN